MKNSSDTIGSRTRDLPTCSAVPQPTGLLRAPLQLLPTFNSLRVADASWRFGITCSVFFFSVGRYRLRQIEYELSAHRSTQLQLS